MTNIFQRLKAGFEGFNRAFARGSVASVGYRELVPVAQQLDGSPIPPAKAMEMMLSLASSAGADCGNIRKEIADEVSYQADRLESCTLGIEAAKDHAAGEVSALKAAIVEVEAARDRTVSNLEHQHGEHVKMHGLAHRVSGLLDGTAPAAI